MNARALLPVTVLLASLHGAAALADDAPHRPPTPAPAPSPGPTPTPSAPTLPASVDLRPFLLEKGLRPRAQGHRPTCSVVTVVQAMEAALARASGRGERLSVEYANWAGNDASRRIDDGSFFQDVWDGYEKHGICPERLWRYGKAFDPRAAPSDEMRAAAAALRRAHLFRLHWIAPLPKRPGITPAHLAEIKRVLASGLPICGGSYHSVLFVGYVDDPREAGGGVLLVRDSGAGSDDVRIPYEDALARFGDVLWIDVAMEF